MIILISSDLGKNFTHYRTRTLAELPYLILQTIALNHSQLFYSSSSCTWHDFAQTTKDKCRILTLKFSSGGGCLIFIEPKSLPSSGYKTYLLQQLPFLFPLLPLSLSFPYFFRSALYLLGVLCFFSHLINLILKVNLFVCSHKPMGTIGVLSQPAAMSHVILGYT